MAIDRSARYPGRFDSPTTARPQGAFKNRTAPGAKDGSYLERDWANDWDGFFGSLMRSAGLTANGAPDTALASQYFDALKKLVDDSRLKFTPVQQGGAGDQAANKIYLGYSVGLLRPSIVVDALDYGGVAFLSDVAALPVTKEFLSSQQAFVNGGLVSVAHGLGVMPKIVMGELICLVAENGWQAGDVQFISLSPDNDDSAVITGFAVRKDASSIYARCGVSGPYGVNINTGATAVPTAANWRLVLRAFA